MMIKNEIHKLLHSTETSRIERTGIWIKVVSLQKNNQLYVKSIH